jgi:hypothetical protein
MPSPLVAPRPAAGAGRRLVAAPVAPRPALDEGLVARLEAEIERGGADRAIARRYGVSHMTVFRLRRRLRQRQGASAEIEEGSH